VNQLTGLVTLPVVALLAYVLAGRREGGLYVARSDGSNARRLRNIAENESILGPKWSLDGKRLFFMRKLKDEPVAIYAIDADGRSTRRVTAGDAPEYLGGTCVLAGILFR